MTTAEQGNQRDSVDIPDPRDIGEFADAMIKKTQVTDVRIHEALMRFDRKYFVPELYQEYAYQDIALPLLLDKGVSVAFISQPSLTVEMIDLLNLQHDSRTLEIGTGSGYSSALMSHLCAEVVTIERIPELVTKAQERFNELQITNVTVIQADGAIGYAQEGPYDRIVCTTAMKKIPDEYVSQLTEGGSILVPIGDFRYLQDLVLGTKQDGKIQIRIFDPVEFVPLITDSAELGWGLKESIEYLNSTRFDH